jgi:hypothetical protein
MHPLASGGFAAMIRGGWGGMTAASSGEQRPQVAGTENPCCAQVNLARIVDPAVIPHRQGAATRPFVVHIVGTGVTIAGGSPT